MSAEALGAFLAGRRTARLAELYEERERILGDIESAKESAHNADTQEQYYGYAAAQGALRADLEFNERRIQELGGEVPDE